MQNFSTPNDKIVAQDAEDALPLTLSTPGSKLELGITLILSGLHQLPAAARQGAIKGILGRLLRPNAGSVLRQVFSECMPSYSIAA